MTSRHNPFSIRPISMEIQLCCSKLYRPLLCRYLHLLSLIRNYYKRRLELEHCNTKLTLLWRLQYCINHNFSCAIVMKWLRTETLKHMNLRYKLELTRRQTKFDQVDPTNWQFSVQSSIIFDTHTDTAVSCVLMELKTADTAVWHTGAIKDVGYGVEEPMMASWVASSFTRLNL